ncbi:MAG: hypothetical protein ACTSPK_02990 [Candidatus Heimdallarchaeota archaeon]
MNTRTTKIFFFTVGIILSLGLYAALMISLADFSDGTTIFGSQGNYTGDDGRDPAFQYVNVSTIASIGKAMGEILWEARAVDVIIIGILLMVASESAATVIKGMEDQCAEFRTEMCETDKFVILEEKASEEK